MNESRERERVREIEMKRERIKRETETELLFDWVQPFVEGWGEREIVIQHIFSPCKMIRWVLMCDSQNTMLHVLQTQATIFMYIDTFCEP